MDESLGKYLLLKLADGYFEIHYAILSTFVFENFHNRSFFIHNRVEGPGVVKGRRRRFEGHDRRVILWHSMSLEASDQRLPRVTRHMGQRGSRHHCDPEPYLCGLNQN